MIAFYGDKKFADLYNMNRLQIQNDIVLHIEDIRQENLRHIIDNLMQAKNKDLKCNTVQKIWFDYISQINIFEFILNYFNIRFEKINIDKQSQIITYRIYNY